MTSIRDELLDIAAEMQRRGLNLPPRRLGLDRFPYEVPKRNRVSGGREYPDKYEVPRLLVECSGEVGLCHKLLEGLSGSFAFFAEDLPRILSAH